VAFLLQRDQEAQQAEDALSAQLADFGKSTSDRLGQVRSELQDHFAHKLAEEMNRYRPLRVVGTVVLVAGLICTVVASFV
jgi:CHASE3 domain sensor protein